MSDIILKRFSLQDAKTDGLTWLAVAIIWLIIVGCAISSIYRQFPKGKQRASWVLIVTCLPIFGLLWYLPFSFKKDDYPFLFANSK